MKIPKELRIGEKTYHIKDNVLFVYLFNGGVVGNINYSDNVMTLKAVADAREKRKYIFPRNRARNIARDVFQLS